jgi:hypothetical protein
MSPFSSDLEEPWDGMGWDSGCRVGAWRLGAEDISLYMVLRTGLVCLVITITQFLESFLRTEIVVSKPHM